MLNAFFNRIKTDTFKTLLGNFTYLSILEVITILFPLLTYPYLIRVIGAEKYGIIVFSQAVIAYVVIVVNFGFNVSATRRVSECRDDMEKLKVIFSSITYLKIFIFLGSLIILFLVLYIFSFEHVEVILLLLGLCLQEIFFPTWLFQGLEKMQFITIVAFFSRLVFLILIFALVKTEADFLIVPLLYSLGGVLTAIVSIVIIYKVFHVRFVKVSYSQLKNDIVESLPFFASRISTVVMERSNVILIGSFFSYEMVSVYDLCSKVISIMNTPFQLVAQVIYPNVARSKNMNIVRKARKPVFITAILIALGVCCISYYVVLLLGGEKMLQSVSVLRLLVWYVPISSISSLYGASTLVVNGYSLEYNKSVVFSLFVYLGIVAMLVFLDSVNLYTMVVAYIIPELFVALYRVYVSNKYKLFSK